MKKQNESGNLRHKIVYSKELTALEKRYLLELMMTKQTESNSESGWIPCSERMPEDGQHVMIYTALRKNFVVAYDCSAHMFRQRIRHIIHSWYAEEITHWMPLPESPNKDNQQEG